MSTLVIKKDSRILRRRCFVDLAAAILVLIFGLIYEQFSHEVYSACMLCAFLVPLLGGTLPCFLINRLAKRRMPGSLLSQVYHSGLATLTVGCVLQGVLEIYGTTNRLIRVYWIAGGCLTAASIALFVIVCFRPQPSDE